MKKRYSYGLVVCAVLLLLGACGEKEKEDADKKGYFKSMARTVEKTKGFQVEMAQRMVDATGSISQTDNTKK